MDNDSRQISTSQDTLQSTHGNFKSYVFGFLLSIGLTLTAYFIVSAHIFHGWVLNVTIALLSLIQVFCQLVFFLHLGAEPKPRWNLLAFMFMLLVVAILVFGSLWIMYNLNTRMMSAM